MAQNPIDQAALGVLSGLVFAVIGGAWWAIKKWWRSDGK